MDAALVTRDVLAISKGQACTGRDTQAKIESLGHPATAVDRLGTGHVEHQEILGAARNEEVLTLYAPQPVRALLIAKLLQQGCVIKGHSVTTAITVQPQRPQLVFPVFAVVHRKSQSSLVLLGRDDGIHWGVLVGLPTSGEGPDGKTQPKGLQE